VNEFLGLESKIAVVTGGASGLGQAVARGLVREGARVVLGDRDTAGLGRTAAELGGAVRGKRTDVTRLDDIAALFALCDEAFGPVEILVTCAGIISSMSLAEMTEEEWDRVLAINTKGTFFCIREAVKRMIPRKRGRIITIGSDSVARGGGRIATAAYTASKGAVVALTRNIARDLLGTGIGVNCVNPGPIDSPMHAPPHRGAAGARHRQHSPRLDGEAGGDRQRGPLPRFGPRGQLHVRGQPEHRRWHPDGDELTPRQTQARLIRYTPAAMTAPQTTTTLVMGSPRRTQALPAAKTGLR
jgi:3-oxoacyl-[acyl-carrier protein] reductase